MNHILEYDNLLQDLESMGYEPLIGYGWCGKMQWGDKSRSTFFMVKGRDERECVRALQPLMDLIGFPGTFNTSKYSNMDEILEALYERGVIDDAGKYGLYKVKKNTPSLLVLDDPYQLNILYVNDLLHENFHISDQSIKEFGIPNTVISK